MRVSKVVPIDRVLNECRRRADDAWWDGKDEEAKLHEQEVKLYEKDKEEGVLWVPNFQQQHSPYYLQGQTSLVQYTYGINMQVESEDGENPNTPFDDVTHWVGNLPRKDTDSDERTNKRNTRRETKSNFLRKKLGLEKK